jgi:Fe-S cluster assembly protein SufD
MKPIRFLFATSTAEEIMITPKVNIDCGESSSFTFIEHYVGGSNNFFFNSSISCFLNKNSSMHHIKIIEESKKGLIFSKTNVQQENSSRYNFLTFNCDSNFSRAKIDTKLNGEGAECSLSGLSLSRDNQQLGTHIVTNHFSPNCYSNQNFKNILLDNSSGIFNGRTIVHKNAQKTNSQQSNKNLILSKSAHMNSNPQLEIYADDVKCSHGSTTGELDNDALFYLRSRGLTLLEAKKLLVRGFAIDLFKNLRHEPTKNHIIDKFENWLIQNTA